VLRKKQEITSISSKWENLTLVVSKAFMYFSVDGSLKTMEANLLNHKRELENSCEQKGWVWEKTLYEHFALEVIDVKLQELGYDFCSN